VTCTFKNVNYLNTVSKNDKIEQNLIKWKLNTKWNWRYIFKSYIYI